MTTCPLCNEHADTDHRACQFRAVIGGIGHHEDHNFWCIEQGDPDGGRTYRQSALEVWADRARILDNLQER